jgi:hypothetical protein
MSYRIGRREPLRRAVGRVAAEEVDGALADAADRTRPLDARIHAVRVHLKRARAALGLMGRRRRARRTDRALRDVARRLARARDGAIARRELRALGAPNRAPRTPARDEADLAEAVSALERVQRRGRRLAGRRSVGEGRRAFVRGYRDARRLLRCLRADDGPARFHAWRKAVKRLALQARLLEDVAPRLSHDLRATLEDLAERLGALHDLTVAESRLRRSDTKPRARLRAAEATRSASALALGEHILSTRPRAISERLDHEWRRAH